MSTTVKILLVLILFLFTSNSRSQTPRINSSMSSSSGTSICTVYVCQGNSVTFTSSNLINGDSIVLVPAQGVDTYIQLQGIVLQYKPGSRPFGQDFALDLFMGISSPITCVNSQAIAISSPVPQILGGACTSIFSTSSPVPNTALTVINDNGPAPGGIVASAVVTSGHAGTLYVLNDTGTISSGDTTATYLVTSIGAGGSVNTVTVTGGTDYISTNGCTTTATIGTGTGLQLDITAANGNGSIIVTPIYTVIRTQ